ncbi:MAG: tRNA preQ1(34) S-adenosylmethionine ribosyltransferase-isomerase QueA [Eubacterium sp.]|nr:tRNA preQ1(34) S-adenosylmethionine ribosyltransferase-isomerase QueA [Eubacterium sp.]
MKTSDFYYELPEELIAQDPLTDRSSSRLMVLDRRDKKIYHRSFKDIADYLEPGDCLVRNNTRVIPARLIGTKVADKGVHSTPGDSTMIRTTAQAAGKNGQVYGAHVEVFLLKRVGEDIWETLVRPGRKLRKGAVVSFGDHAGEADRPADVEAEGRAPLTGEIIEVLPDGNRLVKFTYDGIFEEVLDKLGEVPLPPYIKHTLDDRERYQTVYARYDGSAAAPTAGLHFTEELFASLKAKGVEVCDVTLHVGLGTFRPVKTDDVKNHHMHSEWYRVSEDQAEKINAAKQRGGRIICVGTTSCRTIESSADDNGKLLAGEGETDIFIYPGYRFKLMDALITNFHLPESTLLMLVSAFSDREFILRAYEEAVRERYRFFSFGDAMLII